MSLGEYSEVNHKQSSKVMFLWSGKVTKSIIKMGEQASISKGYEDNKLLEWRFIIRFLLTISLVLMLKKTDELPPPPLFPSIFMMIYQFPEIHARSE
jgi:hypothetical protein